MTDVSKHAAGTLLLTPTHIEQWRAELRRIDEAIETLRLERETMERKLAAAEFLLSDAPQEQVTTQVVDAPDLNISINDSIEKEPEEFKLAAPTDGPLRRRNQQGPTWKDVIQAAVVDAEFGVAYADLRSAVLASPLGSRLLKSDKGYHNAISRLARDEELIRDHGRVFTPEAFQRFMAAVERGELSTSVPQPIAHSPMGEAILKIVAANPGVFNGKGVIGELRRDEEFNAALTPHETGAYNIIARLVRRGQIVRRDDGLIQPGRNFPRDLSRYDQDEIRAPNGYADGALEAGEVGASPNENRSGLRLIS